MTDDEDEFVCPQYVVPDGTPVVDGLALLADEVGSEPYLGCYAAWIDRDGHDVTATVIDGGHVIYAVLTVDGDRFVMARTVPGPCPIIGGLISMN
jgi:hypothetical protein